MSAAWLNGVMRTIPLQPMFRYPLRAQQRPQTRRIAFLLPLCTLLLCAVIWGVAIRAAHEQRSDHLSLGIRDNRNRAIAYSHFIAGVLDRADVAARYLAERNRDIGAAGTEGVRPLPDSAAADPLFSNVRIADSRGAVRLASQAQGAAYSVAGTAAFRRLRAGTQNGPIVSAAGSNVPAVDLTRRIDRADGSFGGVVTVRIPVSRMTEFNDGADFRPHDLISVIGLDGLTLARREGGIVSFGQNLTGKLVMQRQAAEPNGTYIGPSSVDGIPRIFSHRRLARYGLFVSAGLGLDEVMAPTVVPVRIYYIGVTALTLALLGGAFAFWLGLRRREAIIRDLEATNERLREAQKIGRMGDWELDLATRMVVCSDEVCRLHAFGPDQDVLSIDQAMGEYDEAGKEQLRQALQTAVALRRPEQCEVVTIVEGRTLHLRIRMVPLVDADGEIRTVLGTEQDITTERSHEELRAQVAHSARVEAVNVMAATIAHELSQPLTAAGNYLSAATHLAQQGGHSQIEDERLAVALAQANRQIALSGKIIARAREMVSDRCSGEVASLDDIVSDAVALSKIAERTAARVSITAELQPDTGHVAADKVQVQQVLLNLLRNAAQAVADVEKPRIVVSSRREEHGMIEVCVADNGRGLPADAQDLFTAFAPTRRNGLGIGLSICRTIVHSYGGRIWSGESPLGGAAVCFTLPLDELAQLYHVA